MPYPHDSRLKSAIERLNQLEQQQYNSHPFDDKVFQGVVKQVVTGGSIGDDPHCQKAYLEVSPFAPDVDSDGTLHFTTDEFHPLHGVTSGYRWDKVFVDNVPSDWLPVYFQAGDLITFRQFSGQGDPLPRSTRLLRHSRRRPFLRCNH